MNNYLDPNDTRIRCARCGEYKSYEDCTDAIAELAVFDGILRTGLCLDCANEDDYSDLIDTQRCAVA